VRASKIKYLARLHGYVSGDGSAGFYSYPYKKSKAHLNIKIDDQACLSKILEAFAALGYSPGVMKSFGRKGEWFTVQAQKEKIVREILLLGPVGSYTWRIPKINERGLVREWVKAFFDSEATVISTNREIVIESVNRIGMNQLRTALVKIFNVSSKAGFRKDRGIYLLRICGKADLQKFYKTVGFNHELKQQKLGFLLARYQKYYGITWNLPGVNNKKDARKMLADIFKYRGYFRVKAQKYGSFELGLHNSKVITKIAGALQHYFKINVALSTNDRQGRSWIWISRADELGKLLLSGLLRKAPDKEAALRVFLAGMTRSQA